MAIVDSGEPVVERRYRCDVSREDVFGYYRARLAALGWSSVGLVQDGRALTARKRAERFFVTDFGDSEFSVELSRL